MEQTRSLPPVVSTISTIAATRRLPSLNALRAFEAVGRFKSVSAAGGELFVTPGAVSRQIKSLEANLGVALVARAGRGIRLTAAGEDLLSGLEEAFARIAEIVDGTRRRPRCGILVFAQPMFAATWLVPRLGRFAQQAPEVDVTVHGELARSGAEVGGADLVVDWGYFDDSVDAVAEKLTDEEIFPVCSPQLCRDGNIGGTTLLHYEGLPRSWNWPDWPTFLAAAGLDGIDATCGPRFTRELILNAACNGMGVALANTSLTRTDIAAGRLVRPIDASMATDNGYWLLTPRTRLDRPEIALFRNWLLGESAACFGASDAAAKRHRERE